MPREGRGGGGGRGGNDEADPLLGDLEQGAAASKKSWFALLPQVLAYTWPDKWFLKLRLLGCFMLLLIARFLNVAVPLLYARAIAQLSEVSQETAKGVHVTFIEALMPWTALYLIMNVLRGGQGRGFLNALVNVVWYPVQQRSYMRVTMDTFDHIMNLDLEYHLTRKTGTSLKVISRGASAIQTITTTILFTVGPQAIDIISATAVVWSQLSGWISFIIFLTSGVYIPLTVILTELRMKNRREVNEKDNMMSGKMADALINYDTVKYFTNEKMESDSFRNSTQEYLTADYTWTKSNAAINVVMAFVMATGLTSGTLVVVANVAAGKMGVGEVVLFISMLNQLANPLNSFGSSYRTFQKAFVDVENVYEILERQPEIRDKPNAQPLVVSRGDVSLKDVHFAYTAGTPILKGVSLEIPASQKVALVGETGSGKSTILRLLFRFYDPKAGSICVDGTDIRRVTLHSLRKAIGVVPQDCVLFNGSIRDNIAYGGGPGTTEEDIQQAAEDAQIHSHVVSRFPTGYDTVVGERGVRLSGGEKQRIGIARTLLKNPKILLLDEATSALDTLTEKAIQAELDHVSAGRTTIVVAHRLSTIIDSNVIVLLHHGEIMETGTHTELLAMKGGRYADLWNRQLDINSSAPPVEVAEEQPRARPPGGRTRGGRGG